MFHVVVGLDLFTAEVTFHQTIGTVVGQVLIHEATFELSSATVAARYGIELALLRVTLA